jgi:uncharacterized protein YacL
VLIDGRIIAIAKSGFISDTLMIPRSVIRELQFMADAADGEKRVRARHGLDVVAELQQIEQVNVELFQDDVRAREGVDERLLTLAKKYNGTVCTIDFNLIKVAQVEQIPVLNINDLAMSLRMSHLPGEHITIALTTKGNDSTQGVGHLDDGTMVVVEQAKSKIGSVVEVEVIRSLQTSAGKMMFARLVQAQTPPKAPNPAEKRRVSTKSRGRGPAAPKAVSQAAEENKASEKPRTTSKNQRPRQKKSRDNESRLIELVNNQ